MPFTETPISGLLVFEPRFSAMIADTSLKVSMNRPLQKQVSPGLLYRITRVVPYGVVRGLHYQLAPWHRLNWSG